MSGVPRAGINRFLRTMRYRRQYGVIVLFLLLGVILTTAMYAVLRNQEHERIVVDFDRASRDRISAVKKTLEMNLLGMRAVRSLFDGSDQVEPDEFRVFVKPFLEEHTSIQVLEWAPRVPASERSAFERMAVREGHPSFVISENNREGETAAADRREEYYPILYVEPHKNNVASLGCDLASIPACREAMNASCDRNECILTSSILIPYGRRKPVGVRVFLPVYRKNAALKTIEERRRNLEGFVVAILRPQNIVEEGLSTLTPAGVNVQLLDNTDASHPQLLYTHQSRLLRAEKAGSDKERIRQATDLRSDENIKVAGRRWTVVCTARPAFVAMRATWYPWVGAVGVLLLTGLLGAYLFFVMNANVKASELTNQLIETNRRLKKEISDRERVEMNLWTSELKYKTLYEASSDAIMYAEPETGMLGGNPAAIKMFGCKNEMDFISYGPADLSPEYQPDGSLSSVKAQEVMAVAMQEGSNIFQWKHKRVDGGEFFATVLATRTELDGKTVIMATVRDITAQKQADQALRDNEHRYRQLFEQNASAVFVANADTRMLVDCNKKAELMTGYSRKEILSMRADQLHPEEVWASAMKGFSAMAAGTLKTAFESTVLCKTGKIVPVSISAGPVKIDDKQYLIGLFSDISERKLADEHRARLLKRLEGVNRLQEDLLLPGTLAEKLQRVTDAAISLLDLDFCRIWHVGPGDLCSSGCIHATAEEQCHICPRRDICLHLIASSGRYTHIDGNHRRVPLGCYKIGRIASGEDNKFLTNEVTTDPRVHNHEWAKSLGLVSFAGYKLRDACGDPSGVLAMFAQHPIGEEDDVFLSNLAELTSRVIMDCKAEEDARKAEERACRENAKLSAMISGMEEGVVFADANNVIVEINDFMCNFLHQSRENILGKRIEELHHGPILDRNLERIDGFRKNTNAKPFILQRPLGGADVIFRMQPIYRDGAYDGVLLNVIDVTELVAARRQAETANRAKSRFLATMSHEIRTPMTAILGYAEMLMDPTISTSSRHNYLATIRRSGEHLLALINDILDLSRIEAGKMPLEIGPCNVVPLLADVASVVRPRAETHGVSFFVEYAGEIPESILTDGARLRQAMINLAGNAVKFTEKGNVRIVASLLNPWKGDQAAMRFEVIDTGIGIQQEVLSQLFQPFSQGDAAVTQKYGGTGLGLAISHHLAQLLGGELTATSTWGQGSKFTLIVPTGSLEGVCMLQNPAEVEQESPRHLWQMPAEDLKGVRILLAEDGFDNRELIQAVLQRVGAEVETAENGRIAVDRALRESFDVILMDMNMPEMDGYEATGILRDRDYRGPIFALTANAMAEDRERCRMAGCNEYLTKPIDRLLMIKTIAAYAGAKIEGKLHGEPCEEVDAEDEKVGANAEVGLRSAREDEQMQDDIHTRDDPWRQEEYLQEETPGENKTLVSEFINDPEIAEIIQGFVGRLSGQCDEMRRALDGGDYEELRRLAHKLKGAGGSYGYPLLTEECKRLEDAARAGDHAASIESLDAVIALIRAIENGFRTDVSIGSIP